MISNNVRAVLVSQGEIERIFSAIDFAVVYAKISRAEAAKMEQVRFDILSQLPDRAAKWTVLEPKGAKK